MSDEEVSAWLVTPFLNALPIPIRDFNIVGKNYNKKK